MAVNDDIRNALESYGGFSINTRVYNYLGSLGYTGTISDRLAKYFYEDKKGWQALIARYAGGLSEFLQLQQSLFGSGEQGLLFVPEPSLESKDVLYQDAAGTTLADANGDPTGLGLEWSKGLELGPELVTNGTFDNDVSGWTSDANTAISAEGGRLRAELTANSNPRAGYGPFTIPPGSSFEFKVEIFSSSIFSFRARASSVAFGATYLDSEVSTGSHSYIVRNTSGSSSTVYINVVGFSSTIGEYFELDNVSIRELPGNHLTQSTSADRPLYQTDGSLHWLAFDGAGDYLTSPLPWVSMNHTAVVAIKVPETTANDLLGSGETTANNSLLQASSSSGTVRAHLWNSAGTLFQANANPVAGSLAVITQRATGTTLECRLDMEVADSVPISGSITDNRSLFLGSRDGTRSYFSENCYGAIVVPYTMTDSQLEASIRFLAKQQGRTL